MEIEYLYVNISRNIFRVDRDEILGNFHETFVMQINRFKYNLHSFELKVTRSVNCFFMRNVLYRKKIKRPLGTSIFMARDIPPFFSSFNSVGKQHFFFTLELYMGNDSKAIETHNNISLVLTFRLFHDTLESRRSLFSQLRSSPHPLILLPLRASCFDLVFGIPIHLYLSCRTYFCVWAHRKWY